MTVDSPTTPDQHDAFVRLLSCHARDILGFIMAIAPNRSDAEDIFQNTSVALWKRYHTYEPGTNFRAWACRVAYLEVAEYRRRESRLRRLLSDDAFHALANQKLPEYPDSDVRGDALAKCLEKLPRADRRLIERRYFSAQSVQEIADRGSKSVQSIYLYLARIHDSLLRCVQRSLEGEGE